MKKIIAVLMAAVFSFTVAACGPKKLTLRYAAHNLGTVEENNVERQLLNAFEEKYPHITVEVIERPKVPNPTEPEGDPIDQDWIEFLTAKAASNTFPDVYPWFLSGAEAAAKGWAYDLKDVVKDDADFKKVPVGLQEAGQYKGSQYALVTSQYNYGYLVNQTLIEEYLGATRKLTYGVTLTNFLALAEEIYTLGLAAEQTLIGFDGTANEWYNWLPSAYDNTLGYNAFDADKGGFQYNSNGFTTALEQIVGLQGQPYQTKYTWDGEAQFLAGTNVAHYLNSAAITTFLAHTKNSEHALYNAKLDFIGLPAVGTNNPVPSIIDLICVGKGTAHPTEAYQLAKWMTFGYDGYKKRVELSESGNLALSFAPLVDDEAGTLAAAYAAPYTDLPEYTKFLADHSNFIPEGGKVVPGYWSARQPVYGEIPSRTGNVSVGDLMWDIAGGLISNWRDFMAQAQTLCATALAAQQSAIDASIEENNK